MKTTILLLFLFTLTAIAAQGQEKWRVLNVSVASGTEIQNTQPYFSSMNKSFVSGSINLHWEFNEEYYLSSWNGIYYSMNQLSGKWYSSQVTINKNLDRIENLSIGTGLQYRHDFEGLSAVYLMASISKSIKLN